MGCELIHANWTLIKTGGDRDVYATRAVCAIVEDSVGGLRLIGRDGKCLARWANFPGPLRGSEHADKNVGDTADENVCATMRAVCASAGQKGNANPR
jgi:hypothetical protein